MATRSSMAALIARLRIMVEDTGTPKQFPDEEYQATLDANRVRVANVLLSTDVLRLEYASPYPNLEADAKLYTAGGAAAITTGFTLNADAGTFTFTESPASAPYLFGYAYDLHAAAADMWTSKAGRSKNWQGQFGMLAQQQIRYHQRLSWPKNEAAGRA